MPSDTSFAKAYWILRLLKAKFLDRSFRSRPREPSLDAHTVYEHRAWNAGSALLGAYNTLGKQPNVKVPALVVGGRHDGITPPEPGAGRIASLLPNAELVTFENSGHYPFIEETDAFFSTFTNWIAK